MSDTDWIVHPHGPLEPLADNLWRVEGELPHMQLKRVMTVARLSSGKLVLHSAIAMDEPGMKALEALGEPAWMVVPNGWHRIDAARFKARYPGLKVVCPADSRKRVEQVVAVDGTYDDFPQPDPDDNSVRFEHFGSRKRVEGAMLVRSDDGVTAVMCDSLFNLPHQKGFVWWVYGRLLGSTGGPKVTLIGRLFLLAGGGKASYKAWLERLAANEDLVRIVPGHGHVVTEDARGVAAQVASTL